MRVYHHVEKLVELQSKFTFASKDEYLLEMELETFGRNIFLDDDMQNGITFESIWGSILALGGRVMHRTLVLIGDYHCGLKKYTFQLNNNAEHGIILCNHSGNMPTKIYEKFLQDIRVLVIKTRPIYYTTSTSGTLAWSVLREIFNTFFPSNLYYQSFQYFQIASLIVDDDISIFDYIETYLFPQQELTLFSTSEIETADLFESISLIKAKGGKKTTLKISSKSADYIFKLFYLYILDEQPDDYVSDRLILGNFFGTPFILYSKPNNQHTFIKVPTKDPTRLLHYLQKLVETIKI